MITTTEAGTIVVAGTTGCGIGSAAVASGQQTLTLSEITQGDGAYICTITFTDSAGNTASALTLTSFTLDTGPPSTTISYSGSSPATGSTFDVSIVFASSVTGLTVSEVVVSGGSATLAGSGASYTATITPSADGTVTVNVAAGVATDSAGNANTVATQLSVVSDQPDDPVISTSGTTTGTEDTAYSYSITSTDADDGSPNSGTITLTCTTGCGSGSWLSITDNGDGTGTLSGTPADANVGDTAVVITATDGDDGTDTDEFTITVSNINDVGSVALSGTFTEDQVITATVTDDDNDGSSDTYVYAWYSSSDLSSWSSIGSDSSTYTLTQSEVGKYIKVTASYTDDDGTVESHSDTHVTAVANVNDGGTGLSLASDGTVSDPDQGDTLSVSGTLADEDGCTGNTCALAYVWKRDGSAISSETSSSYTLVEADVGTIISVVMTYTDDLSSSNTYTLTGVRHLVVLRRRGRGAARVDGRPDESRGLGPFALGGVRGHSPDRWDGPRLRRADGHLLRGAVATVRRGVHQVDGEPGRRRRPVQRTLEPHDQPEVGRLRLHLGERAGVGLPIACERSR